MARNSPHWLTLLGMGTAAALVLVAGLALGFLADVLLHTFPILVMVGLALGIAGSCRYLYVQFRRFMSD